MERVSQKWSKELRGHSARTAGWQGGSGTWARKLARVDSGAAMAAVVQRCGPAGHAEGLAKPTEGEHRRWKLWRPRTRHGEDRNAGALTRRVGPAVARPRRFGRGSWTRRGTAAVGHLCSHGVGTDVRSSGVRTRRVRDHAARRAHKEQGERWWTSREQRAEGSSQASAVSSGVREGQRRGTRARRLRTLRLQASADPWDTAARPRCVLRAADRRGPERKGARG